MSRTPGESSVSGKDTQDHTPIPSGMSTPTSPTDTRHPLSKYESISQQHDGLAESFQSTDTIRRRPDNTGGYGTQFLYASTKPSAIMIHRSTILTSDIRNHAIGSSNPTAWRPQKQRIFYNGRPAPACQLRIVAIIPASQIAYAGTFGSRSNRATTKETPAVTPNFIERTSASSRSRILGR